MYNWEINVMMQSLCCLAGWYHLFHLNDSQRKSFNRAIQTHKFRIFSVELAGYKPSTHLKQGLLSSLVLITHTENS